jgi:hypothetical protein
VTLRLRFDRLRNLSHQKATKKLTKSTCISLNIKPEPHFRNPASNMLSNDVE